MGLTAILDAARTENPPACRNQAICYPTATSIIMAYNCGICKISSSFMIFPSVSTDNLECTVYLKHAPISENECNSLPVAH